ncbi:MAG: phosphofructokinase [Acidimicrobiales bacterium]|nr:phosphofructokinase [Acidimicrobiales bacterium]
MAERATTSGDCAVKRPTAAVFTPTPLLTVTIEAGTAREGDDIHLHAGGQGVWVAAMLARSGIDVSLTCPLGRETGKVLGELIRGVGMDLRATEVAAHNGAYVHDRRQGTRVEVGVRPAGPLERHDMDDIYGRFLVAALQADVCVLGGPDAPGVINPAVYGRLAEDLRLNGSTVVVDLTGDPLRAVLERGVSVLKLSDEELGVAGQPPGQVAAAAAELGADRVGQVIVTSDGGATVSPTDTGYWVVEGPRLDPIEPRGAGDAFTATYTASVVRGLDTEHALRRAVAAGTLNVTRRGLASGDPALIDELASTVRIEHRAW